jgi:hypothetical protein
MVSYMTSVQSSKVTTLNRVSIDIEIDRVNGFKDKTADGSIHIE